MKSRFVATFVGVWLCLSAASVAAQSVVTCKHFTRRLSEMPAQAQCQELATANNVSTANRATWLSSCVNYANQWDACVEKYSSDRQNLLSCQQFTMAMCMQPR